MRRLTCWFRSKRMCSPFAARTMPSSSRVPLGKARPFIRPSATTHMVWLRKRPFYPPAGRSAWSPCATRTRATAAACAWTCMTWRSRNSWQVGRRMFRLSPVCSGTNSPTHRLSNPAFVNRLCPWNDWNWRWQDSSGTQTVESTFIAFAEIVARHTNLVYSAASRQVDSPDIAAEVAQSVFVGLARSARSLSPKLAGNASLAGWLCRSARNISLNFRRDEFRRHSRERQAMENLDSTSDTAPDWERLRPVLDEAMAKLSESDYDALVLRFFKNQDLRSVGLGLGVSDDAAQKRGSRALA